MTTSIPPAVAAGSASTFLRKLVRKPVGLIAVTYLVALLVVGIVAPLIWPEVLTARTGDLARARLEPSAEHLLGTDSLGRDILTLLLVGTRVTLIGIATALVVAIAVGATAGLFAGYFGGRVDRVVTWIANLMFSLPGIVIILLVLAVFPLSLTAAMVTLGLLASPGMMRIVRSAVLPVRNELYVAAAKTYGISDLRIVTRHVLPRITGPIVVQTSLMSSLALVSQSGLAFLGLIIRAPAPSWGSSVAEALQNIISSPWMIWAPGLVVVFTCLAFGAIGDTLRDVFGEARSRGSVLSRSRAPRLELPATEVLAASDDVVLQVSGLSVAHVAEDGSHTPIVKDVSFQLRRGEALALVGESGCGKSLTSMALVRALPPELSIVGGSVRLDHDELLTLPEAAIARLRGRSIAVVAQEPMASLNPVFKAGTQVAEAIRQHHDASRASAKRQAVDLLQTVGLKNAEAVAEMYPHELSGGMAQRVAIARALAGDPDVLVADEPTTALDVTVQAEILDLLKRLQRERDMALLLVSHDWGVVAQTCDRVAVMYAGQIVETGPVDKILDTPRHPYAAALIAANPFHGEPKQRLSTIPGSVPKPGHWPSGCHFIDRCQLADSKQCAGHEIPLLRVGDERSVRCVRVRDAVGQEA